MMQTGEGLGVSPEVLCLCSFSVYSRMGKSSLDLGVGRGGEK